MAPARRLDAGAADAHDDLARVMAFVNTRSRRGTPAETEALTSFQALAEWARSEGVVPAPAADRLLADARRHPAEAARALDHALELREALHAAFKASADGRQPSARLLATLGAHLGAAHETARLVLHERRLHWAPGPATTLEAIARELARAAGALVSSSALARVRACAADDCRWWFIDDTRNRSRRWCEMKTCGNREKLRRYRARDAS